MNIYCSVYEEYIYYSMYGDRGKCLSCICLLCACHDRSRKEELVLLLLLSQSMWSIKTNCNDIGRSRTNTHTHKQSSIYRGVYICVALEGERGENGEKQHNKAFCFRFELNYNCSKHAFSFWLKMSSIFLLFALRKIKKEDRQSMKWMNNQ